MNKQQFGSFIAGSRKDAGLTQKELAGRLHVTDKAVSKWERALSYPDVTLLEPLAEALGLGVEELMSCRRLEASEEKKEDEPVENTREEQPVRNLMEISRENMRSERRKHIWQTALALALMLAVTLGTIWYCDTYVSEQLDSPIVLKETVGNENYLYVEDQGHLLRLKCGADVDFNNITLESEHGDELDYRMDWEDCLREYLISLDKTKPVIYCGDLNVAHQEIDLKNPRTNRGNAGFSDQEREKMTDLLSSGFTDTFRHLYPDREGAYSWWSYRFNARKNNAGWRIDYFIVSDRLKDRIVRAEILADTEGSDHCPVLLELDI